LTLNDTNSAMIKSMIKKSVGRISDSVIRQDHAIYWIHDEVYQQNRYKQHFPLLQGHFTHPPRANALKYFYKKATYEIFHILL